MAWRSQSGKSAGHKGDGGSAKGSGKWQYWQGAWSPSQHQKGAPWRRTQGKGQDTKAALSFPGYDTAQKDEKHISEIATVKEKEGDGYASALQRAINQVRKAEARTRKAMADKRARAIQWTNWVAELKKTFAKEKSRYQAAVSRLERELEEAFLEQEGARAGLRRVAASMEVESGHGNGLSETVDAGSEMAATPPPRKLPAYSLEVSTPLQGAKARPPREAQQPRVGDAMVSPGQTPADTDPYMASPSAATRRSSPSTGGRKKLATPDGACREGVKAAVRPVAPKHAISSSQSLADKLEAKRKALVEGGALGCSATVPPPTTGVGPGLGQPQHHILYDDGEEKEFSDTSDLEAWYNDKFGDPGLQAL
ncbi:CYTB5-A, partial [Symbiodinium pilosum]